MIVILRELFLDVKCSFSVSSVEISSARFSSFSVSVWSWNCKRVVKSSSAFLRSAIWTWIYYYFIFENFISIFLTLFRKLSSFYDIFETFFLQFSIFWDIEKIFDILRHRKIFRYFVTSIIFWNIEKTFDYLPYIQSFSKFYKFFLKVSRMSNFSDFFSESFEDVKRFWLFFWKFRGCQTFLIFFWFFYWKSGK